MLIHSIKGKLEVHWLENVRAIQDKWYNYSVTPEEFKEAVLLKGLSHSKKNKGFAWIVDSSDATGIFTQQIQKFIEADVFPAFAAAGVKYFITVPPQKVGLTSMTVKAYSEKVGPAGITLIEVESFDQAIATLKLKKAA
jgi:hypothetical protein